jgi:hypothetical protein
LSEVHTASDLHANSIAVQRTKIGLVEWTQLREAWRWRKQQEEDCQ